MEEKIGLSLLKWAKNKPQLSKEERLAMIREYRKYGDPDLREKLVYGSIGLVASFVARNYGKFIAQQDQINPDFEDLVQTGMEELCKAVDKFDPDVYKFEFSTYLYHRIEWKLRREIFHPKSAKPSAYLEQRVNADEDSSNLEDLIADESIDVADLIDKLDVKFLKEKVLPYLPATERRCFELVHFQEMTFDEVADAEGLSKERVRQLFDAAAEKVQRIFKKGASKIDEESRGVKLNKKAMERLQKNQEMFEKYGKTFLKQHFRPLLPKTLRAPFDNLVLNYRGQEFSEAMSVSSWNAARAMQLIDRKLQKLGPELLRRKELGILEERQPTLKQQQKKNRVERLISKYGGRFFLQRYFLPLLDEMETKAFVKGVLEYDNESVKDMAAEVGVSPAKFKSLCLKAIDKLRTVDFEILVKVVDGKHSTSKKGSEIQVDVDFAKQKSEVVKHFGDELTLRKLFLPMLPKDERDVFDCLYLKQNFTSYQGVAEFLGKSVAEILNIEKIVLTKLESTNIEELKHIQLLAEGYIDRSTSDLRSNIKGSPFRKRVLSQYGGVQFLREMFIPQISAKIDKEIFEKFVLQGLQAKDLKRLFNGGRGKTLDGYVKELDSRTVGTQVNWRVRKYIMPQLEKFKESFEDFDNAVREFYMRKGFESIHPQDFERMTYREIVEKTSKGQKKFAEGFGSELMERAGGEREVLRGFCPTLDTIVKKLVLLKVIADKKSDTEIAKELNLTVEEVKEAKKDISKSLEEYADKKDRQREIYAQKNKNKTKA